MEKRESVIPTKREVEEKISKVGDYVKMDYLSACLKKNIDFETRKFVLTRLSGIYESKGMLTEAGKLMRASADINTTFDGKISDFLRSMDMYARGGNFDEADVSFTKALAVATERQKGDIRLKRKESYKRQAKDYMTKDKRKNAMEAYEKLLTLDVTPEERREIQNTLAALYEKLGKVREFYNLKKSMNSPSPVKQTEPQRRVESSQRMSQDVNDLLGTF